MTNRNWYVIIGDNGFVYDVKSRKDEALQEQERIWKDEGSNTRIVGVNKQTTKKALLRYFREEM
jgi:hypothetical protein